MNRTGKAVAKFLKKHFVQKTLVPKILTKWGLQGFLASALSPVLVWGIMFGVKHGIILVQDVLDHAGISYNKRQFKKWAKEYDSGKKINLKKHNAKGRKIFSNMARVN